MTEREREGGDGEEGTERWSTRYGGKVFGRCSSIPVDRRSHVTFARNRLLFY